MLKYKQENEADTEEHTNTFLINDGKAIIIDNTFNFDNPDMQGVI
jgi:flavorubredoxin